MERAIGGGRGLCLLQLCSALVLLVRRASFTHCTRFAHLPLPLPQLTNWKPGGSDAAAAAAAAEQAKGPERAKRADRYSSKEQASKQRLAELVDQHKASRNGRGGSSSAGSASRKAPGSQSFRR